MKYIKYFIITILLYGTMSQCFAKVKTDSLRILFVGNSYTFASNMPHLASLISDNSTTKLITSQSSAGSATLKDHWNGKKGLKTKKLIKEGNYDVVVLQEHSMGTINNRNEFLNFSKKMCDLIKASGAKPYFYVTWARLKVPQYQDSITKVYKEAAKENDSKLVLVGEAWRLARKLRPDIELYKPDGSHPADLGAFLTACVFVKTLTSVLPEKLPNWYFIKDYKGDQITLLMEDAFDITFCLKIASEFVKN